MAVPVLLCTVILDTVFLILTIGSFVVGLIAAIAAIYGVVYSRQQLKIAREQSESHPILAVKEVRLIDFENVQPLGLAVSPPNKLVSVSLINRGKVTAFGTRGRILFDSPHVMPLEENATIGYYSGGGKSIIQRNEEGQYEVWIGRQDPLVIPEGGEYHIEIPIQVRSDGPMVIRYSLSTPMDGTVEGQQELRV